MAHVSASTSTLRTSIHPGRLPPRVAFAMLVLISFAVTVGAGAYWLQGGRPPSPTELVARAEAAQTTPGSGDIVRLVLHTFTLKPQDSLSDPYHLDLINATPPDTYTTILHRIGDNGTIAESDVRQTDKSGALLQQDYTLGTRQHTYLVDQNVMWIEDFAKPAQFDWPIDARQLAMASGLRVSGAELDSNGALVDVVTRQSPGSDGSSTETAWGIRQSDSQLTFYRTSRILPDGSRILLSETDVLDYAVNPSIKPGDFTPPATNIPTLDFTQNGGSASFAMPPEREVDVATARAEAKFHFRTLGDAVDSSVHTYVGSQPPISWDSLSVEQRGLQYATAISHAYRTLRAARGTPFMLIQGRPDEMTAIMQNTPVLWSSSRRIEVETVSGSASVSVGPLKDGSGVAAVARFSDSLVVLGATGATEDELLQLIQALN
jgi:hypothetical protein